MYFFDNLFQDSLYIKKQIKDAIDGHYKIINFWSNYESIGKHLFGICFNQYFDSGIEVDINYLDRRVIPSKYFFKMVYWYYSTNMELLYNYFKNKDDKILNKFLKKPIYIFIEANLQYANVLPIEKIISYLDNGLKIKNNKKEYDLSNLFIVLTSYSPINIVGDSKILNINFSSNYTKELIQEWETILLQFNSKHILHSEFSNWYLQKIEWNIKSHKYFSINQKKIVKLCLILYKYIPFNYLPKELLFIIINYVLI